DANLVYGPPIKDGFYYDIALDRPISTEDFPRIEAEMAAIIKERRPFIRIEMPREEGLRRVEGEGNKYKLDNAMRAEGPVLSFYRIAMPGDGVFEDLCRGPHLPDTGRIGAFKVMSVSASYWHGDANSDRLHRVYGTAWPTKKLLDEYLARLEEAKKRDHRKLGRELGIFMFDDDVGPGLPLFLPNGAAIIEELERLAKETERKAGYMRVRTPHICKEKMYLTSGHLPYYKDSMFPPMEIEGTKYYLKPMNCPHHHKIYASELRSYRDLPVRLAEYGTCYRYEQSGELFGLMRVRSMQMNDAHIYCSLEQFEEEFLAVCRMYLGYFGIFGISNYMMRFSTHSPEGIGKKYVGQPELWKATEERVRRALRSGGIPFEEIPGEAAFYGPKIDVQIWSAIGREFTLATNQVDFAIPARFGLTFKNARNEDETPLCIHRAPLGTHERFIGFLIEHYAGAFPPWLAPVQVRVANVTEREEEAARRAVARLLAEGFRVEGDINADRIAAKAARAEAAKVPYFLAIGAKEAASDSASVRCRGRKNIGVMKLEEFLARAREKIEARSPDLE
ncbi:MAG: threonine--tRNA ligase, partial [Planctomycetota bacterium]|nr:threonine--tRNA ligase [Planctomycetota bacterium]